MRDAISTGNSAGRVILESTIPRNQIHFTPIVKWIKDDRDSRLECGEFVESETAKYPRKNKYFVHLNLPLPGTDRFSYSSFGEFEKEDDAKRLYNLIETTIQTGGKIRLDLTLILLDSKCKPVKY